MEVRSLFGLNFAFKKKTRDGTTDRQTDGQTLIQSRLFATKNLDFLFNIKTIIDSHRQHLWIAITVRKGFEVTFFFILLGMAWFWAILRGRGQKRNQSRIGKTVITSHPTLTGLTFVKKYQGKLFLVKITETIEIH